MNTARFLPLILAFGLAACQRPAAVGDANTDITPDDRPPLVSAPDPALPPPTPVGDLSRPAPAPTPEPAPIASAPPRPAPMPVAKATPLVSTSSLNRGGYDRREAFIDTDHDGKKFDFHQPPRPRESQQKR